jgi:hypothetical protein
MLTPYHLTWHNIPDDFSLYQQCCNRLKSCSFVILQAVGVTGISVERTGIGSLSLACNNDKCADLYSQIFCVSLWWSGTRKRCPEAAKSSAMCEFVGFHSDASAVCILLGYGTVLLDEWSDEDVPIGHFDPWVWEHCSVLKLSGISHPLTQHHILEEWRSGSKTTEDICSSFMNFPLIVSQPSFSFTYSWLTTVFQT